MTHEKLIDHLFRHQYGKMVSVLTRIFGLSYLETVEDAVQDTFINAMQKWRIQIPENPEAWLTAAAKNRALDILRKINSENSRSGKLNFTSSTIAIDDLFLDHEVEDSQLRMIFTACHPKLDPKDQIAFALKTIAGFSTKEIASALLLKEETIKKRLSRARKAIKENQIKFDIPHEWELLQRIERVHEVIYLIFNEGFHSNQKELLIKKDLCGEALRLNKLLITKIELRSGSSYALFALMCFHASRLESKISENLESIDLKNQDRSKWYRPLINLGFDALMKAHHYPDKSFYYIEAAIAYEHLKAKTFESTNWEEILKLYQSLYEAENDTMTALNITIVLIQLKRFDEAESFLNGLDPVGLEQRMYLYYGVKSELYKSVGNKEQALKFINLALDKVRNDVEKKYLEKKKKNLI